jgi:hypothetical protein
VRLELSEWQEPQQVAVELTRDGGEKVAPPNAWADLFEFSQFIGGKCLE